APTTGRRAGSGGTSGNALIHNLAAVDALLGSLDPHDQYFLCADLAAVVAVGAIIARSCLAAAIAPAATLLLEQAAGPERAAGNAEVDAAAAVGGLLDDLFRDGRDTGLLDLLLTGGSGTRLGVAGG